MKIFKKIVVLALAILVVFAAFKMSFAAQIQTPSSNNTSSNESTTNTENEASNSLGNNATASNSTLNGTTSNTSNTMNANRINTTNAPENLPSTGIEDTYLNFALIILLALVLGMFSLVQYRRIIKKENE